MVGLLLLGGCAHYPRLSLSTKMRLEADTHLIDLSHMDAQPDDWVVHVVSRGGSCSGALVESDVVLTAQHCVVDHDDPRWYYDPGDVRIELGGDYLPWGRVGVVGIVRCPCWEHGARGDIAALVLETPLDGVPTRRARAHAEPAANEDVLASGYGDRNGVRTIPDTGWAVWTLNRNVRTGVTTSVGDGSFIMSGLSLPGDSGGPVLALDTGEVIGIVSRGTEGESSVDPSGNKSDAVPYTMAARIDTCAGVIARARAMARGATASEWPSVVCR